MEGPSIGAPLTTSVDSTTDEELMVAFQRGSQPAFEQLYRRHQGRLFRYLARECGNRQAGNDIYQETWLRVVRQRERYVPSARFSTWLFAIAQNCLIDHYRRQQRRDRREQSVDLLPEQAACPLVEPDAQAGNEHLARALRHCLAGLPAEQRQVFLLKEETGHSLQEIAALLGVEFEATKSRLRYALRKLRECLSASGVLETAP